MALGRPFAAAYAHSGMVGHEGEKMSKSLGNLVFVHRLVHEGVDPMVIRLVLMAHHYRSDWEWTAQELEQARARIERYRAAARRGGRFPTTVEEMRAALRDDLDTVRALEALDAWAEVGTATGPDAPDEAASGPGDVPAALDALFGITLQG